MDYNDYEHQKKLDELEAKKEALENAMPYLQFMEQKLAEVESLRHRDKLDNTYHKCQTIIYKILVRFVRENNGNWDDYHIKIPHGNDLKTDESILDKYKFNRSDTQKSNVINEFKDELATDLRKIIFDLKKTSNPSTPDKEI